MLQYIVIGLQIHSVLSMASGSEAESPTMLNPFLLPFTLRALEQTPWALDCTL